MNDTEVATAKYVRKQLELYPPNKDMRLSVSDAVKRIQDKLTDEYTYDYEASLAIRELIKYITANDMTDDFLIQEKKVEITSRHGEVHIYKFKDSDLKIVIKKPRVVENDDVGNNDNILGIEREALIARDCLNPLRNLIPNFVNIYTYDNKSGNMYLEYVDGVNLGAELDNMSSSEVLQCITQVSLALYMAQNTCSFAHYDLHTGNIMLNKLKEPRTIIYPIRINKNTIKYYSVTSRYIVRIFDLDSAYIRHDKRDVGFNFYDVGAYPDVFLPGSDLNKLLCFMHRRATPAVRDAIDFIYSPPVDRMNRKILGTYCEYSPKYAKEEFPNVIFTPPYVYADKIMQKPKVNWLTAHTKDTYKCTGPYYSVSWYLYGDDNNTETVSKLFAKVMKYTERTDIYYYMLMIYSCQLQRLKLKITDEFNRNLIKTAHDSLKSAQRELLDRKIPINQLPKLDNEELKRYMNFIGDTTGNKTTLYKQIYRNAIVNYWN